MLLPHTPLLPPRHAAFHMMRARRHTDSADSYMPIAITLRSAGYYIMLILRPLPHITPLPPLAAAALARVMPAMPRCHYDV